MSAPARAHIRETTHRLIASRFPPVGVFDDVCVYRPSRIILPVNQVDHYEYRWDASGAISILKLANVASGAPRQ